MTVINTHDPTRGEMVDRDTISRYLDMLFGPHDFMTGAGIALRGLGEKGTPGEGKFMENVFVPMTDLEGAIESVYQTARRWNEYGRGAFIVPKIVVPQTDANGRYHFPDASIISCTALCVDLDAGDTHEALKKAVQAIGGRPSMVVESGGITAEGKPKIHAYWALKEPTDPVEACRLMKALALHAGGDVSFQRAAQVIRIPGTIHGKNGKATPTKVAFFTTGAALDFPEIHERMGDWAPVLKPGAGKYGPHMAAVGVSSEGKGTAAEALSNTVSEGGTERTRWAEFNKVAGVYVRQAREGIIDLDTARQLTLGWMNAKMDPPWPMDRFEREFEGIVRADRRNHPDTHAPEGVIPSKENTPEEDPYAHLSADGLRARAVANWVAQGPVPERRWIIPGLLAVGKPHLFVAEGGAGKTTLLLDLSMRVSGAVKGAWMGREVNPGEDGIVVFITAEDDYEELKIRLRTLFTADETARATKFILKPLVNDGGSFPLVNSRSVKRGNEIVEVHGPSVEWEKMMIALHEIQKTDGPIKMVILDTLNATMHGEENSATVVQEYFRQAGRVCGELGAALVLAHHVRKRGKDPITNRDEMRDAVRGSSAILGSVRVAIGVWPAVDWQKRMAAMNEEPKPGMLYHSAVIKANNPEAMRGTLTLLREEESGLLVDVTARDKIREDRIEKAKGLAARKQDEKIAWLVAACRRAAIDGHPFKKSGKAGLYERRTQLPPLLSIMGRDTLRALADEALLRGVLSNSSLTGRDYEWLDVPGGIVSQGNAVLTAGEYTPDWKGYAYDEAANSVLRVGS